MINDKMKNDKVSKCEQFITRQLNSLGELTKEELIRLWM